MQLHHAAAGTTPSGPFSHPCETSSWPDRQRLLILQSKHSSVQAERYDKLSMQSAVGLSL